MNWKSTGDFARRWARAVGAHPRWLGATVSILAAAALFMPPVIYQLQNFHLGWHDVGNYTRANYNFFEFGRFAVFSDGTGDFFVDQHFEPFFFLLCLPTRLWGTSGYVGAVTAAIILAAGYVFVLARAVSRSSWVAALCAAAYVANPYTYAIALSYRVEAFGILFLLALAYHSYVGQLGRAWLALALALTVKEDMWVYALVVALLVARRDRLRQTAAFAAAALCYYVVVVQLIGGSWYPSAHYFNSFYESEGHVPTKLQIARQLLGRWREFLPLLFTGPGLRFQASLLLVGILSGWRYGLACAVMLFWLMYPGGPPRSNLAIYYSYAPLLMSFVILPFALVNLRAASARVARRVDAARCGGWAVGLVMTVVVATDVVMHLPGHVPGPIAPVIERESVYGKGPGVKVRVVRRLIDTYLTADTGSVLAQFYTVPSVPQHRQVYLTLFDRGRFLDGRLKPKYVLLDLGAADPYVPPEQLRDMAAMLRRGDEYAPLYDLGGVLLYQRRAVESR